MLGEDIARMDRAVIRNRTRARGVDLNQIRDLRLVRVAHHPRHAGHGRQFFGRALRITPCNQNPGRGILTMRAADGVARVFICRRRYRAGVQDDEIG